MRAEVNDAHIFQQILDERRDPRAVLKEAISNAHDAGASELLIQISASDTDRLKLVFRDNGEGLDRHGIHRFFGLGFSEKATKSTPALIGEKGLGSKLLFNCHHLVLKTRRKGGHTLVAHMDDARDELREGRLPSYTLSATRERHHIGTTVEITDYQIGKAGDAFAPERLIPYLRWFSAAGTIARLIGRPQIGPKVVVEWEGFPNDPSQAIIHGHELPENSTSAEAFCRQFDPFEFEIYDSSGAPVGRVNVAGAVLESEAHVVKDRYSRKAYKGFFLCKDSFAIRSVNSEIAGGTGVWQNFHVMANCQALELNASREDFINTGDGTPFAYVIAALREFLRSAIRGVPFTYRGRPVENPPFHAGAAYLALKKKKQADRLSAAREKHAVDLVSLARRGRIKGSRLPDFEPEDEFGLLAWVALSQNMPRAGSHRVVHASGSFGGSVVLETGAARSRVTRVMRLCIEANSQSLEESLSAGFDGVIAWRAGEDLGHRRDARILVLSDLLKRTS